MTTAIDVLAAAINDAQIVGPEWWGRDLRPSAERMINSLKNNPSAAKAIVAELLTPEMLAEALHKYSEEMGPAIELNCWHDDTEYDLLDFNESRGCHQGAKDIIALL